MYKVSGGINIIYRWVSENDGSEILMDSTFVYRLNTELFLRAEVQNLENISKSGKR